MKFPLWLDTFLDEKDLDLDEVLVVQGDSGPNHMPIGVLIEHIKIAPAKEQGAIKEMLVKLDFHHADIRLYFKHLAKALVI